MKSRIAAEESAVVDFQSCLEGVMRKQRMKRKDLAAALDVSESHVSQIFNDEANPTLKTAARVLNAAGYELVIRARKMRE